MNARPRFPLRRRAERGATVVEFALIAGIFCMLLIGICEFGRVLFYWNTASEAVRLGARTATVCDVNSAVVKARISSLLPLLTSSKVTVSYSPSGCDVSSCEFVTVTVSNVTVPTVIPFLKIALTMPPFTTTLPRESLQSTINGTVVCQ